MKYVKSDMDMLNLLSKYTVFPGANEGADFRTLHTPMGSEPYSVYAKLLESYHINENPSMSIDDGWELYLLEQYENAFESQFHYAIFYAWSKLKQQEIKNVK